MHSSLQGRCIQQAPTRKGKSPDCEDERTSRPTRRIPVAGDLRMLTTAAAIDTPCAKETPHADSRIFDMRGRRTCLHVHVCPGANIGLASPAGHADRSVLGGWWN